MLGNKHEQLSTPVYNWVLATAVRGSEARDKRMDWRTLKSPRTRTYRANCRPINRIAPCRAARCVDKNDCRQSAIMNGRATASSLNSLFGSDGDPVVCNGRFAPSVTTPKGDNALGPREDNSLCTFCNTIYHADEAKNMRKFSFRWLMSVEPYTRQGRGATKNRQYWNRICIYDYSTFIGLIFASGPEGPAKPMPYTGKIRGMKEGGRWLTSVSTQRNIYWKLVTQSTPKSVYGP